MPFNRSEFDIIKNVNINVSLDERAFSLAERVAKHQRISVEMVVANAVIAQYQPEIPPGTDTIQSDVHGWPILHVGYPISVDQVLNWLDEP
jgi:hypothetical protein